MIVKRKSTQEVASRMLARYGVAFIWDAHVAAAAAYGLGDLSLAEELTEIAEAAERDWLARTSTCLFSPTSALRGSSHV